MAAIRHIAGEFKDRAQRCIRCNAVILDARGAAEGQFVSPYPEGPVWVYGPWVATVPLQPFRECAQSN